jgi:hypothetical protein
MASASIIGSSIARSKNFQPAAMTSAITMAKNTQP